MSLRYAFIIFAMKEILIKLHGYSRSQLHIVNSTTSYLLVNKEMKKTIENLSIYIYIYLPVKVFFIKSLSF